MKLEIETRNGRIIAVQNRQGAIWTGDYPTIETARPFIESALEYMIGEQAPSAVNNPACN